MTVYVCTGQLTGKITKDKVTQFLRLHTIRYLYTLICKRRDTANEQRQQLKLRRLVNPLSYF